MAAAGSDLLDDVFFSTEVDEKVVSDLVGSLESQLAASGHRGQGAEGRGLGGHGAPGGAAAAAGDKTATGSIVINNTRSPLDPGVAGKAGVLASKHGVPGNGKILGATSASVQTLNGSSVVMVNSHTPGSAIAYPSGPPSTSTPVTLINNGPSSSVLKGGTPGSTGTVIQTSFLGPPGGAGGVPSQQPGPPSSSTVTLVRPPIHATQNGSTVINSTLGMTTPAHNQGMKCDSPKTIIQAPPPQQTLATTGGNLVIGQTMQVGNPGVNPPPGTMATGMSKGVVNTLNMPRTPAVTAGSIRATITPPVLAPRLPQPPQNTQNIQNFQLSPEGVSSP